MARTFKRRTAVVTDLDQRGEPLAGVSAGFEAGGVRRTGTASETAGTPVTIELTPPSPD
jgi:hypothetical protein